MLSPLLVIEAFYRLAEHDRFMKARSFADLCDRVRAIPIRSQHGTSLPKSAESLCSALNLASAFYGKQVLCLQRSAVLSDMLRRRGVAAHVMFGVQQFPFRAHAWVQVDGVVIDDPLAQSEPFQVLEVL